MTPILVRFEPELLAKIDELRGEVPRSIYIRYRLAEAVRARSAPAVEPPALPDVRLSAPIPPRAAAKAKGTAKPTGRIVGYDAITGEPITR